MYFKRKIDDFLIQWKNDPAHKPLIVKGARQIGKTESILHFAKEQYNNVVYINFVLDRKYRTIASDGYDVDTVTKNISLANPALRFTPGETIIVFERFRNIRLATTLKCISARMEDLMLSAAVPCLESIIKRFIATVWEIRQITKCFLWTSKNSY